MSSEDTVARRIVMQRATWDMLVHVAEALESVRGVEVSPADVAKIALEAGLEEVQKGLDIKTSKKTPSGRRKRPTKPLNLTAGEREEIKAILSDANSVRARQRRLGLWLGLRRKEQVRVEWLRDLVIEHDAYNVANFAQNMKKDGSLFSEKKSSGKRTGWKLTKAGIRAAEELLEEVLLVA